MLNRWIRAAAGMVCAGLLLSCGGGGTPPEPVNYQFLFNEFQSRVFAENTYVLRTQSDLDALWNSGTEWTGLFSPPQPAAKPVVDFSQNTVVGISLGVGLRCYMPEIVSVTRSGETLTVAWRTNRDRQITTMACIFDSSLQTFLAVPAWPGPVVFDHRRETPESTIP